MDECSNPPHQYLNKNQIMYMHNNQLEVHILNKANYNIFFPKALSNSFFLFHVLQNDFFYLHIIIFYQLFYIYLIIPSNIYIFNLFNFYNILILNLHHIHNISKLDYFLNTLIYRE
jgi:hypothetical protein